MLNTIQLLPADLINPFQLKNRNWSVICVMKNFNKTHWDFFFLMENESDLKVASAPFKTS